MIGLQPASLHRGSPEISTQLLQLLSQMPEVVVVLIQLLAIEFVLPVFVTPFPTAGYWKILWKWHMVSWLAV